MKLSPVSESNVVPGPWKKTRKPPKRAARRLSAKEEPPPQERPAS